MKSKAISHSRREILFVFPAVLLILSATGWAKHSKEIEELPLQLLSNHILVVQGLLNGQPSKLVIDTGARPTAVDSATAERLGLRSNEGRSGTVAVVGGRVPAYLSMLSDVELGPIHVNLLPVVVTSLSWIRQQTGVDVDAVVGWDVLANCTVQIDYRAKRISFGPVRVRGTQVPLVEDSGMPTVEASLDGKKIRLLLDTGGSGIVLFPALLSKTVNRAFGGTTARLNNLAGEKDLQQIRLKNLTIGAADMSGRMALIAGDPKCCSFQGILGISALQFDRVTFDSHRGLVALNLRDEGADLSLLPNTCPPDVQQLCREPILARHPPGH